MDIEKEFINIDLKELIMIKKKIQIFEERLINMDQITCGLFNRIPVSRNIKVKWIKDYKI